MIYTLPIDFNILPLKSDDIIDMSNLKFPVEKDKQIRSSFLFIRNTGIKSIFMFNNCDFDMKSQFLIDYMTIMMDINIPELTNTWVSIITHDSFESYTTSILSDNDIQQFIDNNGNIIKELHRFIVSIPLCAMNLYTSKSNMHIDNINMNDFKTSYFNEFNPYALSRLLDYKEIITLSQKITDIEPVFYKNYFNYNDLSRFQLVDKLINGFPYFNILNIMMSGDESIMNDFIRKISDIFNKNEET